MVGRLKNTQTHTYKLSTQVHAAAALCVSLAVSQSQTTHKIPQRLFCVVCCLQRVHLQKSLQPTTPVSLSKNQKTHTNVRSPLSVTSRYSFTSSFVSSLNSAPFVSRAHASSPSAERYASCGGTSSPVTVSLSLPGGVQYFAKMCCKHASNCLRQIREYQPACSLTSFERLPSSSSSLSSPISQLQPQK